MAPPSGRVQADVNDIREDSISECAGSEPPLFQPWNLYTELERSKFLTVLFLVSVSGTFDYYVLGVVLEPIKQEFHVSDSQLGLLGGMCFALCYALTALPFARWSDHGNRCTVLTFALAGWSLMTLLSGFAKTFIQLGIARLGVGAMQPGETPPLQSLIADYYPPERRAWALAVTIAGSSLGYLIGVVLGGYIAATLGWRNSFILSGLAGIALAILAKQVLREPRNYSQTAHVVEITETLKFSIARLGTKRSYVGAVAGLSLLMFFSLGVSTFIPSFVIRILSVSLQQASVTWGISVALSNLLGTLAGGWLAERLGSREIRWYAWLPAIACVIGAILYWLALSATQLWTFIPLDFAAELVLWTGTFAAWPSIHAVCGAPRRALAIAIAQFAYILVGSGLGPLTAGALSDALNATYDLQSLRYSLQIMTLFLIPAAFAFYLSGHWLRQDVEN